MQIPDTEVKPNSKHSKASLNKASLNKLEEFKNKASNEKHKTTRVKMKTEISRYAAVGSGKES